MNKQTLISVLVVALAWGLPAAASGIYKRVNEDGVVEYSDRPSADGTSVQVADDVVGTGPAEEPLRFERPPRKESAPPQRTSSGTGVDTAVANRTTSRTRGASTSNMNRTTSRTSRSVSEQAERQSRSTGATNRSSSRRESGSGSATNTRSSGTRGTNSRRGSAPDDSRGRDANRAAPVQEYETDGDPGRATRNAVRAGGGG